MALSSLYIDFCHCMQNRVCLVQNPTVDDPPNAGLSNKADYKGDQKKQFGSYRWISCQDPSLLDAERCEFILIGATEDLQGDAFQSSCLSLSS